MFKITKFKWTTIEEQPFGIVCYRDQQDNDFVVLVDLLKVSNVQRYQLPLKNDPKFKVKLTSGPSKSDFFVVWQKRSLFIADKNSTQFIQHDIQTPINVVACHPGEDLIATGDIIGRIMLWRNFHQKYPVREELHWHHQIVLSLAFSQSGTMLYSGGVECVLVKWTINNKCIEKEFLPRLAGSVRQISVNPKQDKLAISTDDNAIQIINSNLTQLLSIQDFTIASSYDLGQSDPFPCGIKVDPRNHHLVTNGRLGHLQFFSTKTMKLLFNMDICNRNVIPRQRKLNIFSHQVTHVAFAGKWMATVENWNDRINYPESSLKFWKFLDGQQTYSLHTQIEQPHEKEVNFLEFPQKQLEGLEICVTGGHDKCIRVWSLEKSENVKNPKYIWLCIEQLSYKNLPIYSMSFSQDSTLLAAGFGNILCLYDTFKFQLKAALSTPANFDGSINRVLLTIPPNKKMSSPKKKVQVKSIQERRKALDMMYSMINGPGGNELVKDVTQEKHRFFKQNKMKREKSANMSKHEKQEIFRRVLLNTELTFGQKIQILHQLNIYYKITDRMEEEVIKFISRTICDSRLLYKNLHRNLSQVRNHEKYKVQWRFRTWMLLNSKRNRNIVTVRKLLTQPAKPEVLEKKKQAMEKSGSQLPIKNTTHINNVLFCMGELPHLVLVTTADRLLVWNILTLKLQGSFKLQAKFITLDPLTNLCAVFTQHNEVFVIHPSPAITLHFQKDLPKIYGAIWSPVDLPKVPKDNVNWQSTSHLLFLTHKQEICTFKLPGDEDYNNGLPFVNKTIGSVATPFASMMALKITEDPSIQQQNLMTRRIGITGSGSVREVSYEYNLFHSFHRAQLTNFFFNNLKMGKIFFFLFVT